MVVLGVFFQETPVFPLSNREVERLTQRGTDINKWDIENHDQELLIA